MIHLEHQSAKKIQTGPSREPSSPPLNAFTTVAEASGDGYKTHTKQLSIH